MQQSAVPELAHTQTRPIHWVATATALAAVAAGSSLFPSEAATAAQPKTGHSAVAGAPDAAAVEFGLNCGSAKTVVQKKASGDLDGDGRPETVAVVRCDAGSGSPPNGIYVITQPTDAHAAPRVVATLVAPKDRLTVSDFAVEHGVVTATLLGYSSSDVPSCCPDLQQKAKWQWRNGTFVRSTPAGALGV